MPPSLIDWSDFYLSGALGTGVIYLFFIIRARRMLGSYRMVLDMMDMAANMQGRDRLWFTKPDEDSAKRFLMAVAFLVAMLWPLTLPKLIQNVSGPH